MNATVETVKPPAPASSPVEPSSPYSSAQLRVGGLLSLVAPGLGHIYQGLAAKQPGRLCKGVLFMVSLWGMFFYGMWLGQWRNVYLPHKQEQLAKQNKGYSLFGWQMPNLIANLYVRLHYAGQFWIGAAAWPALWSYYFPESNLFGDYQRSPVEQSFGENKKGRDLAEFENESNDLQRRMGKVWDIAWVYTVIAGVLNILVIYDAWAGPAHAHRKEPPDATGTGGST